MVIWRGLGAAELAEVMRISLEKRTEAASPPRQPRPEGRTDRGAEADPDTRWHANQPRRRLARA